jgi:hypothetical protein
MADETNPVALSAERPWPGMRPYREADAGYFFGRNAEVADLQARVERSMLTLLYGRGGLGKTSLVRAGLAPRLAGHAYLPVYMRPRALLADGGDPVAAASRAIEAAAQTAGVEASAAFDAPSLWELFHRESFGLWDTSNRLVTAVLVFDQFEEIFQLIDDEPAAAPRAKALLDNIAELVENRLPARLAAMDLPEGEAYRFDIAVKAFRVVLSFREDYLPQVRKLHAIVPAVIENHVRLEPLTGRQALEVVQKAGGILMDQGAARELVAGVGKPAGLLQRLLGLDTAGTEGAPDAALANLEVEPAILSVVCFYLNAERQRRGQSTIDVGLVKLKKPEDIFDDYYRKAMAAVDPQARRFVETHLVTAGGERVLYPVKAVAAEGAGLLKALAPLFDQGILRKEWFAGEQRLEISHDLLLRPIRAAAEVARAAAERRRRLWWLLALLGVAAVAFFAFWSYQRVRLEAEMESRERVFESLLVAYTPLQRDAGDPEHDRNRMSRLIEAGDQKSGGVDSLRQVLDGAIAIGGATDPITARRLREVAVDYVRLKIDRGDYGPQDLAPLLVRLRDIVGESCATGLTLADDERVFWFADRGGVPEACK